MPEAPIRGPAACCPFCGLPLASWVAEGGGPAGAGGHAVGAGTGTAGGHAVGAGTGAAAGDRQRVRELEVEVRRLRETVARLRSRPRARFTD